MTAVVAAGCVRSCGVSTGVAALATAWPAGRRLLLVEADPAGGDLAVRYGLPPEPGLVSLAAAARRSGDPELVWVHTQSLPSGALALAGPVGAGRARAAVTMSAGLLGRLAELDADVLVDCGRLDSGSPVLPVWAGAAVRLLATRPQLADLHHLVDWLDTCPGDRRPTGLLLVGRPGYPAAEITDTLGVAVLGELPDDPAGVAGLPAGRWRGLERGPLLRHARTLIDRLLPLLPQPDEAGPADPAPRATPSTAPPVAEPVDMEAAR